jgi:outer membrane protein assembly factor BamB
VFDGTIYGLSSLGEELWSMYIGQTIRTSPAIEEGGRIYLGADDGCLYAIV